MKKTQHKITKQKVAVVKNKIHSTFVEWSMVTSNYYNMDTLSSMFVYQLLTTVYRHKTAHNTGQIPWIIRETKIASDDVFQQPRRLLLGQLQHHFTLQIPHRIYLLIWYLIISM